MENLKAVFLLAARLMIRSRRTLVLALLSGLPVAASLLAVAVVRFRFESAAATGLGLATELMAFVYLQFMLLALTLFYGTALIGDEVEDRTLTYLLVRPVPRATIYLGKFLACVLTVSLLLFSSVTASFAIVSTLDAPREALAHLGVFVQDLAVLGLGVLAYCALFGFLGTALKRPLLVGIVFCLVWESVVTYIPGHIHRFTVLHYLQSLLPHPTGQRGILQIFQQVTSAPVSVITLAAIAAGLLALSCWLVSRKEYVLPS